MMASHVLAQVTREKCQALYFYKMIIAGNKDKKEKADMAFKINRNHFSILNDAEQVEIVKKIYIGEWRNLSAHEITQIADEERKECILDAIN